MSALHTAAPWFVGSEHDRPGSDGGAVLMATYWARGGQIHTHGRIMTDDDAGALLELYLDEAIAAYMADDFDAWAEAAKLAIEVNAAIRGARRHRVTGSRAGVALDHIDGNPLNNDPANLRAVQISENRRAKP